MHHSVPVIEGIIPSLLTVGGIDYAVTKIQHSFGSSLDSLTVPASVKGMGSSIRNCVNLRTIKLSSPLMPGIDVETLKSVDTLTCKILVPEGCLDAYRLSVGEICFPTDFVCA